MTVPPRPAPPDPIRPHEPWAGPTVRPPAWPAEPTTTDADLYPRPVDPRAPQDGDRPWWQGRITTARPPDAHVPVTALPGPTPAPPAGEPWGDVLPLVRALAGQVAALNGHVEALRERVEALTGITDRAGRDVRSEYRRVG